MHTKFCSENVKKKKPLGRPKCRWEDNFRMDLREAVWKYVDWMRLSQDRDQWRALVNTEIP
jgi:hypothetical protein